ncbi:sialomucin core protein 24-like [Hippoglossus stenolepis]|uniref:sialomucin core protein 24-like n=1 Tax=Hippoglossus stenolepis TaxID=195615 RepID=UPI00159C6828|nr:sialomucin core protein 24-like [Hippoglossus stenolepis]
MDPHFAALTCCLLAISFAAAQTEKVDFTTMKPSVSNNMTQTTELIMSSHTAGNTTSTSKVNENTTTAFSSTTLDNKTPDKTTIHPQTSQSTAIMTPLTNSTSLTNSTPAAHTPTSTVLTVPASETTTGYTRTPDTTEITSANSSRTVNTTSHSVDAATQGLGLNISEQNLTIVFSVVLGVFALSLVVFMFHRCRQKIQYLHQPLNNSDCPDAFVADDDTLVISGGLYDGHPIDDNAPAAPDDESQFRLEFLH